MEQGNWPARGTRAALPQVPVLDSARGHPRVARAHEEDSDLSEEKQRMNMQEELKTMDFHKGSYMRIIYPGEDLCVGLGQIMQTCGPVPYHFFSFSYLRKLIVQRSISVIFLSMCIMYFGQTHPPCYTLCLLKTAFSGFHHASPILDVEDKGENFRVFALKGRERHR